MNLILAVLATLFTITLGRPQYNYPTPSQFPSGNYGAPSQIGGGSIGGGINQGIGGGGISQGIGGGGIGQGIGGGGIGQGIGGGGIGQGIGGGGIGQGIGGGGIGQGIGGGGIGQGIDGGGISQGISGGSEGISGGSEGISGGGGVLIQKHIYVHVAPPEPEELRPQRPISLGQSSKHYKIIFIKAPSAPAPTSPSISLGGQSQEKTLIYVLVKRPEDAADISIPTAAPTQPSKPEVYFIRYKAKSEAVGGGGGSIGGSGSIGGGSIGGGSIGGSSTGGVIEGGSGGSSNIGGGIITGTGGSSNIGIGSGRPSTQYGPPGQSGPY